MLPGECTSPPLPERPSKFGMSAWDDAARWNRGAGFRSLKRTPTERTSVNSNMRSQAEIDLAFAVHCENLQATLRRICASECDIVLDLVLRDEDQLAECLRALSSRRT